MWAPRWTQSSVPFPETSGLSPHRDVAARALRCVDDEVTRAGFVDALLFVHSLAGGTGSGLGSRLAEAARRRYCRPRACAGAEGLPDAAAATLAALPGGSAVEGRVMHIVSACVAPGHQGDTAVQSLNALLALAHLRRHADLVLLLPNDAAAARVAAESRGGGGAATGSVGLADINDHLACVLFTLLQGGHSNFPAAELVSALAPHPSHCIAVATGCPAAAAPARLRTQSSAWSEFAAGAAAAARAVCGLSGAAAIVAFDAALPQHAAAAAAAAGGAVPDADSTATAAPLTAAVACHGAGLRRWGGRVAAVAVTAPAAVRPLVAPLANSAMAKVTAGAYLHWYEQYGVGAPAFAAAYATLRRDFDSWAQLEGEQARRAAPRRPASTRRARLL
eukprot:TRINITY_DN29286_c0_g1_i4.p1 TRINITY_DN29286_c0_g1~~TRINITY_DN29286_c0_g1_i4.p1  ORF type:complete len:392 (+),score=59.79 TRINITY_DN29286_c0_g1_i4:348-1523(+)